MEQIWFPIVAGRLTLIDNTRVSRLHEIFWNQKQRLEPKFRLNYTIVSNSNQSVIEFDVQAAACYYSEFMVNINLQCDWSNPVFKKWF